MKQLILTLILTLNIANAYAQCTFSEKELGIIQEIQDSILKNNYHPYMKQVTKLTFGHLHDTIQSVAKGKLDEYNIKIKGTVVPQYACIINFIKVEKAYSYQYSEYDWNANKMLPPKTYTAPTGYSLLKISYNIYGSKNFSGFSNSPDFSYEYIPDTVKGKEIYQEGKVIPPSSFYFNSNIEGMAYSAYILVLKSNAKEKIYFTFGKFLKLEILTQTLTFHVTDNDVKSLTDIISENNFCNLNGIEKSSAFLKVLPIAKKLNEYDNLMVYYKMLLAESQSFPIDTLIKVVGLVCQTYYGNKIPQDKYADPFNFFTLSQRKLEEIRDKDSTSLLISLINGLSSDSAGVGFTNMILIFNLYSNLQIDNFKWAPSTLHQLKLNLYNQNKQIGIRCANLLANFKFKCGFEALLLFFNNPEYDHKTIFNTLQAATGEKTLEDKYEAWASWVNSATLRDCK